MSVVIRGLWIILQRKRNNRGKYQYEQICGCDRDPCQLKGRNHAYRVYCINSVIL